MSTPKTSSDDRIFPQDAEVTITVTGRVVHSSQRTGAVVIEYLNERGFPDRTVAQTRAAAASAVAAEPASPNEIERRRAVYRLIADSTYDEADAARIRSTAPYGPLDLTPSVPPKGR